MATSELLLVSTQSKTQRISSLIWPMTLFKKMGRIMESLRKGIKFLIHSSKNIWLTIMVLRLIFMEASCPKCDSLHLTLSGLHTADLTLREETTTSRFLGWISCLMKIWMFFWSKSTQIHVLNSPVPYKLRYSYLWSITSLSTCRLMKNLSWSHFPSPCRMASSKKIFSWGQCPWRKQIHHNFRWVSRRFWTEGPLQRWQTGWEDGRHIWGRRGV